MHQNWPNWPSLRTHPAPWPRPGRPCPARSVRPAARPCAPTPCLPAGLLPVACACRSPCALLPRPCCAPAARHACCAPCLAPHARQPSAPTPACAPSTPLRARLLPSSAPCPAHCRNTKFCIVTQPPSPLSQYKCYVAIQFFSAFSHTACNTISILQYKISFFHNINWAVAQKRFCTRIFFFFQNLEKSLKITKIIFFHFLKFYTI